VWHGSTGPEPLHGPARGDGPGSLRLLQAGASLYPVGTPPGLVFSARQQTQVVSVLYEGRTAPLPGWSGGDENRRRPGGLVVQEAYREAHLSAQCPSTLQASRVSPSHVDPSRSGRVALPSSQGSPQAVGLIWRIRDRRTFLELRRSGRRVRSGVLTVTFVPDPPDRHDPPRVAFAVPRRVGPAVVRNRIRRRIRSSLRTLMDISPSSVPPGAYLFSVRPEAQTRTYEALSIDVQQALSKLERSSRPRSTEPT